MSRALRNFLRIALVGICLVSVASNAAVAQQKSEPPLITVTGEAEVRVVPDEVVFDLTVQTLNRDLRIAKSQTDERLKKVIELTRRYKIAPADVQTDYIKLEPRYRNGDETRTLVGYSVRKDVVFTLRDASQAEELLSELIVESGISRINSVSFRSSQLRKYRDQARALAIKAAQEKATALTAEIGQKIGKAYSIEEESPSSNFRVGTLNQNNSLAVDGSDSSASEGTLALGQIKVNARVTVRFILE
ncbi:MAG TPA: SIMPL domain-containing protein [Pyrinomonadaceae bacterium]|nr:SIMPL domain-containing protein [Pyrinomonadaceae bacterium]